MGKNKKTLPKIVTLKAGATTKPWRPTEELLLNALAKARSAAKKAGLKKSDVRKAIKKARAKV